MNEDYFIITNFNGPAPNLEVKWGGFIEKFASHEEAEEYAQEAGFKDYSICKTCKE